MAYSVHYCIHPPLSYVVHTKSKLGLGSSSADLEQCEKRGAGES